MLDGLNNQKNPFVERANQKPVEVSNIQEGSSVPDLPSAPPDQLCVGELASGLARLAVAFFAPSKSISALAEHFPETIKTKEQQKQGIPIPPETEKPSSSNEDEVQHI